MADTGIEHGGATQVIDRYLRDVCASSSRQVVELSDSSTWRPQQVGLWFEPFARHHRQPVGIG